MASLSGSMDLTTKTFVSASNFMVIKFKTDGSVEKSGFRASWRTEAQTCGGDLVATPAPQILASPNYPRNYPGKKWLLYPWSISRTTDIQRELFFKNSKVLGLGRQIGLKFWGAFWLFPVKLLALF